MTIKDVVSCIERDARGTRRRGHPPYSDLQLFLSLCLVVIFPIAVVIVRVTFVPVVTIVFVINTTPVFVHSDNASRSCQQCQQTHQTNHYSHIKR